MALELAAQYGHPTRLELVRQCSYNYTTSVRFGAENWQTRLWLRLKATLIYLNVSANNFRSLGRWWNNNKDTWLPRWQSHQRRYPQYIPTRCPSHCAEELWWASNVWVPIYIERCAPYDHESHPSWSDYHWLWGCSRQLPAFVNENAPHTQQLTIYNWYIDNDIIATAHSQTAVII